MLIKKDYYQLLFEQYKKANGINKWPNFNIIKSDEFLKWLRIQRKLLKEYSEKLQILDLIDKEKPIVELGQGQLNTVTEFLLKNGYNVSAITTFDDTFTPLDVIAVNRKLNVPDTLSDVETYITQLPFISKENYTKFMIENCRNKSIVIGSYGQNSDKDKYEKVMKLQIIRQQIIDSFNQGVEVKKEYIDEDGNYFDIVSVKPKVK